MRNPFTICGFCITSDHDKCRSRRRSMISTACTCKCNDQFKAVHHDCGQATCLNPAHMSIVDTRTNG